MNTDFIAIILIIGVVLIYSNQSQTNTTTTTSLSTTTIPTGGSTTVSTTSTSTTPTTTTGLTTIISSTSTTILTTATTTIAPTRNFNLLLRLYANDGAGTYDTNLNTIIANAIPGDIILVDGATSNNLAPNYAQTVALGQPKGVVIYKDVQYASLAGMQQNLTILPAGYQIIIYDYEPPITPEYTTNETLSIVSFQKAQSLIQQYNTRTASNARMLLSISGRIISSTPTWNWNTAAQNTDIFEIQTQTRQLDVNFIPTVANIVNPALTTGKPIITQVTITQNQTATPQQVANATINMATQIRGITAIWIFFTEGTQTGQTKLAQVYSYLPSSH